MLRLASKNQYTDWTAAAYEWNQTMSLQTLCHDQFVYFRPEFVPIVCVYDFRFRAFPGSFEGAAWRDENLFLNESPGVREIHSINSALIRAFVEKRNTRGIRLHGLSNVRRS